MKRFLYLATCLFLVTSLCLCFASCDTDDITTGSSKGQNETSSSVAESTPGSIDSIPDTSVGTADSSDESIDNPVTDSSASTSSSDKGFLDGLFG